ncbi:MAG: RNA pseudouridine synthase [Acetomicrobium sp.]
MSLSVGNRASLVVLEPITGRPHQLRVHLSHIGHPIVGDVKYGDSGKEAGRPMLHAYSLEIFENDLSYLAGKKFCAPLPADVAAVINLFDLSFDTIIGML